MVRTDTRRTFGDAERADPSDETVINGAPYCPGKTIGPQRSGQAGVPGRIHARARTGLG